MTTFNATFKFAATAVLATVMAGVMATAPTAARADTGLTVVPPTATAGLVTVFYPTADKATQVKRGSFTFNLAPDAPPVRGKGRLIVLSHGSGGSPWPLADLAQHLVAAGYIVALPEHAGDNFHDHSNEGPPSWKLRPIEVSQAIDTLAQDARFAKLFDAQNVGVWGMSAGGHTALTLAGGQWSNARHMRHCLANMDADYTACTGGREDKGDLWTGIVKAVAPSVLRWKFGSDANAVPQGHTDPRIKAVVAGVPFAADFDLATLTTPVVPLGLIRAGQDLWLRPQFHSDPVIGACKTCEVLADLPQGGHGALLAPLPQNLPPWLARLLADPPGFNRAALPTLYDQVTKFFNRHLLDTKAPA